MAVTLKVKRGYNLMLERKSNSMTVKKWAPSNLENFYTDAKN